MHSNKPISKKIYTDKICDYGCGKIANFQFSNKKFCCSRHYNSCSGKRENFSKTQDHKENAAKSLKIRQNLGITKSSQIQATKTRKKNGHYKKLAKKMRQHWAEHPWNNNPKWSTYKNTDIQIQSFPEYKFLENLECENSIAWVKENVSRGPCFYYNDPIVNKQRMYISDFRIDNTIFEIKGSYTWNKKGKDKNLELINRAKLDSVKKSGYNVVLVLEGKNYKI